MIEGWLTCGHSNGWKRFDGSIYKYGKSGSQTLPKTQIKRWWKKLGLNFQNKQFELNKLKFMSLTFIKKILLTSSKVEIHKLILIICKKLFNIIFFPIITYGIFVLCLILKKCILINNLNKKKL